MENESNRDGDWPLGRGCPNNLDFLRFLLATVVILSHSWPLLLGQGAGERGEPFRWLGGGQTDGGLLAVNGFFAISGFLIVRSWEQTRGNVRDFALKRARRIYPAYVAVAVVCYLGFGWLAAADRATYWSTLDPMDFLRQIVLLDVISIPHLFPAAKIFHDINGATWTVRYEAVCYGVVALWGVLGLCRRPRLALVPLVGFGIAYMLQVRGVLTPANGLNGEFLYDLVPALWHGNWLRFLFCFWAGAALYLNRRIVPRSGRLALLSLLVLLLLRVWQESLLPWLPICGTYLLFYVAFLPLARVARFARHGDFSYGLYLYAWPVQQLLIMYFGRHLHPLTLFALSLAATLPFAFLSWHLVEKRFLKQTTKPATMPQRPIVAAAPAATS